MTIDYIPAVIVVDSSKLPAGPPGDPGTPGAPGAPGGAVPVVVRTWTASSNAIPMTDGTTYQFYMEYQLAMPARGPGDVIIVNAQGETTNPYPFNVMADRYIGFGPISGTAQNPQLCPIRAENVTPDMHHMTIDCMAVIDDQLLTRLGLPLTIPAGWIVTLTMVAASTDAQPGEALINEGPGYGELVAVIYKAAATA